VTETTAEERRRAALAWPASAPVVRDDTVTSQPGIGGPANGMGWGSNGRTSARTAPRPEFSPGMAHLREDTAERQQYRRMNRAARSAKTARMMQIIEEIAEDAEASQMIRLSAADKLLDRLEGKPVQKQEVELSGPDGEPLQIEAVRRIIVDPSALADDAA
jgi:hypothetical protein